VLPKLERLTRSWQYEEVFRQGKPYRQRLLVLHVWRRPASVDRPLRQSGFIVSKKVGGAVVRNAVKRRINEAYRLCRQELQGEAALVWIARPAAATADYRQLAAAVTDLLTQAGLYAPDNHHSPAELVTSS